VSPYTFCAIVSKNFVYFNLRGKMPSDKAALCTLSFITPGTNSKPKGSGGSDLIAAYLNSIKTKKAIEEFRLQ